MLSSTTLKKFRAITEEAYKMVSKNVDLKDITGKINYAAIFTKTFDEYKKLSKQIKENGTINDPQPTGDYYLLEHPFSTKHGTVTICRAVKPHPEHVQKGYIDFEVKDYAGFKTKYKNMPNFSVIENVNGIELIKLADGGFDVRAFFPQSF